MNEYREQLADVERAYDVVSRAWHDVLTRATRLSSVDASTSDDVTAARECVNALRGHLIRWDNELGRLDLLYRRGVTPR